MLENKYEMINDIALFCINTEIDDYAVLLLFTYTFEKEWNKTIIDNPEAIVAILESVKHQKEMGISIYEKVDKLEECAESEGWFKPMDADE